MTDASVRLVRPSVVFRDSFLEALAEHHDEGFRLEWSRAELEANFAAFVAWQLSQDVPGCLRPGRVPQTVFWLVDTNAYLGRLALRPELNDRLRLEGGHIGYDVRPSCRRRGYGTRALALGLGRAREIGLSRVLVTCNDDNVGSRRIIESNGGELEDRITIPGVEGIKRRYWIAL